MREALREINLRKETIQPTSETAPFQEFERVLRQTVSSLATLEGVDFEKLPQGQQQEQMLNFLRTFYLERNREWALSRQPPKRVSEEKAIEINPETIILKISNFLSGEEQRMTLGPDRKRMLALFVALTEAKIDHFLNPWFNRQEFVSAIASKPYTLDQLYLHFFLPFGKAGILEVSSNKGYRLACNPADAWETLQSNQSHHALEVIGFEEWFKTNHPSKILLEEYQLPLLKAIFSQLQASSEGYLNTSELREQTGLGRDWLYKSLQELEKQGIITKSGNRYMKNDVNIAYITELVGRQEGPITVDVKVGKALLRPPEIESRRAQPLEVKSQEVFEFPQVSWADKDVATTQPEFTVRERLLKVIYRILTADLLARIVTNEDRKPVYLNNLPVAKDLDQAIVLGVLDFLGIGPEEAKNFLKSPLPTLAAAIKKLEDSPRLVDELLLTEIKSRLAGIILDEVIPKEEDERLSFAEVMKMLEESLTVLKKPVQPEITVVYEVKPEEEALAPDTVSRQREKLIQVIKGPFEKELRSATSQETLFVDPLPPIAAYNFHRVLSDKSSRIPWEALNGINLAYPPQTDHHPRLTPAGALVAALYLTPSIHNRVLALKRTEDRAIEIVAAGVYHLLKGRLQGGEVNEKEKEYIQKCLMALSEVGITCLCEDCQKNPI